MKVLWCKFHMMRANDTEHHYDVTLCNIEEKEIHIVGDNT
jgi:hypothetical protein